jgi:peptidoglycan/LPS O-acetylase OafA/YrhL
MNAKATSSRHIPALDGLRGVAIILVLLNHTVSVIEAFFPGWSGVDLFFVLSGYLITGRLLATKGRPNYLSNFYRNRALRILPLYYAVVIGFLLVVHLFVQKKNLPEFSVYTDHWKSFLVFTQNWTFILHGFPRNKSLTPLWTLAVEEQFYLIWPLVILAISSATARGKIFVGLIILILITRTGFYLSYPPSHSLNYYNTFFRADALLIGSLLCQLHNSNIKLNNWWIKLGALILLAVFIVAGFILHNVNADNPFYGTIGYTLLALFFACILHLAVVPGSGMIAGFLRLPFLRFCGKISYGLYLFHDPIIQAAGTKIYTWGNSRWPGHPDLINSIADTICVLPAFLLATLSFYYFESFFLRLKSHSIPPEPARQDTAIS